MAIFLFALLGCERYNFESAHVELSFSADTLSFDTIFTPIGSTTFSCKVYNRSNKNMVIDEVFLGKRNASPFLMNADGQAGYSLRNLRLAKKDSMFIFIEVQKNQELLLTDQIGFVSGGLEQGSRIELVAYGQEVELFENDTVLRVDCDFTPDKPYLINGNVTIDSGVTATVKASAKLYFGKNCGIIVNGALRAEGLASSPCIFSHPRYKDAWYSTAGGQWQGITVNASGIAKLTYAQLRGARQAFYVLDTLDEATLSCPQLRLSRNKIEYSEIGMNICKGSATVDNCLVVSSSTNAVLVQGGSCEAFHSTFATYETTSGYHSAQVALQNFRIRGKKDTVDAPLKLAHFGNSIIYGSNVNELVIRQRLGAAMDYKLEHCTIKIKSSNLNNFYSVTSDDPKFKDVSKNDFHLSKGSPAVNAGKQDIANSFPLDLEGFDRSVEQDSSMGCYVY